MTETKKEWEWAIEGKIDNIIEIERETNGTIHRIESEQREDKEPKDVDMIMFIIYI